MTNLCLHCKEDIVIRNPSGFCDHLYYPDNCWICQKILKKNEIKQEKSNEELNIYANAIIDSLKTLNPVERYKVISSLYHSLLDICKSEGIIFENE